MHRRTSGSALPLVVATGRFQCGLRLAVAQCIQLLQRDDAVCEHALTALLVDVARRVARQGCDHIDAVVGEKCGGVFLSWLEQHSQVAAVDDFQAACAPRQRDLAEMWIEFRRAAGEIQRMQHSCRVH